MGTEAYYLSGLNELAAAIHERNIRLGFYEEDKVRPFDGMLMNVVSELAEAQEEWRNGHECNETYWRHANGVVVGDTLLWARDPAGLIKRGLKPEGIPTELADAIIRILDICAFHGIDVAGAIADKMEYNSTREYRHGGKRS